MKILIRVMLSLLIGFDVGRAVLMFKQGHPYMFGLYIGLAVWAVAMIFDTYKW